MAPNQEDGQPQPGQKTLHVWSKPIEQNKAAQDGPAGADGMKPPATGRSSISEAVSMIKTEDFANLANTPCARQGLITGIAAGSGLGGLHFVLRGNVTKAANWAVGIFVFGSMASYEYCQYLRRAERIQMKRHIEVVTETRREQAKKMAEARKEHDRLEAERKGAGGPWYKFW